MYKFLFLIWFLNCTAQNHVDAFWGVDTFDNIYYSINNTLIKKTITKQYEYSFNQFGKPTKIDLSAPFQILVFFADYKTLLVLDNRLNIIETHTLPFTTTTIANASNNKLWMFNSISNVIELYNLKTNKVELTTLPTRHPISTLKSDLNNVYALYNQHSITTYNYVGRKTNSITAKDTIIDFNPINNHIYYSTTNGVFNNTKNITRRIKSKFSVNQTHLYFLDNHEVKSLRIPKN